MYIDVAPWLLHWLRYMYILITSCLLDNGPHYHNSGVIFYLTEVNSVFNITLKEYNNFEAGEGKSQLDSHFAHISHKIVRWVRLGNDLESGEQVAELIKVHVHCCQSMYTPLS